MKVAVVGTRGFPDVQGGIETHCEKIYPRLAQKGVDITVFARAPYVHTVVPYDYEGVHVVPVMCPRILAVETFVHTFICLFKAWKLKPDIVHLHAIGPALLAPFFRLTGAKVIYTHHGQDYNRAKWGFFAKFILRLGERYGTFFSNRVIVISEYLRILLSSKYKAKNLALIYNGVDIPDPLPLSSAEGWLAKYGLSSKQRYVFALGRFVKEKGFHDLIQAYRDAAIPDCKLVIAGAADHRTRYADSLADMARENGVILTGFIHGEELQALFSNAALFVIPSYHEGLPIVLLEAMSYNLDVIASDIQANEEIGLPEDCYYATGDIRALSGKLKEHLNSPQKRNFADIIKLRYNWDKIAEQTYNLYMDLIKK